MSRTWMRLSNGREELVVNPDHVKRLLDEGATIIPDPTLSSEQEATQEDAQPVIEEVASEPEQVVVEDSPVVRKRGRSKQNS